MEPPPVQYVTTSDGKRLAYTVSGKGRVLVLVPNTMMHAYWAWFQFPELFEGLAKRFRFVHFNYRGQGMSTRGLDEAFSLADWQRDLATVIDAVGGQSVILMAVGHGCHIAVRYALDHPGRVDALILNSVSVSMANWPMSYFRVAQENWELHLRNVIPRSITPAHQAIWQEAVRATQTQAEFRIALAEISRWDLEPDLPGLRVPALVLHPYGQVLLAVEEAQRFAASLPNGRCVLVKGDYTVGDSQEILAATDSFLAGLNLIDPAASTGPRFGVETSRLSHRELEILRQIAAGRSNQEIANDLVLSVRTVERHITNLYAKIGARRKADATAYALRHGIT
jgi:pimeloyl-ACP methyl ester carboxylesterase/DNA-binding CsgD family transcriptional regulator